MPSITSIKKKIRHLEAELASIATDLEELEKEERKTFGDFYGAIQGFADLTEEEIEEAKYKFPKFEPSP